MIGDQAEHPENRGVPWLSWLLGAAVLAAVIAAALRLSEERAFVRLAQQAEPRWLAVAVLLQAATYAAQGEIWRLVGDATGCPLSRKTAFELSLAKLFADQALPSAGLSSSILIAKALEERLLPAAAVKASVLINIASYHLAYVIALVGALIIMAWRREANTLVVVTAVVFLLFSMAFSAAVLAIPGRGPTRLPAALRRLRMIRRTIEFLDGADPRLVRSPRVLARAVGLQEAIVVLDAATVWILILALGAVASIGGVFASFMVASLFRTMGVVPGGLGTFEATSVVTLRMIGVEIPVALASTLLFRGLSFWLPMLPGYWISRRAVADHALTADIADRPRNPREDR